MSPKMVRNSKERLVKENTNFVNADFCIAKQ